MKRNWKKRLLSLILVVVMILGLVPDLGIIVSAAGLDTSKVEFDVENPAGHVTVSFTDNGVRPEDAAIDNEELYGTAVGTIIDKTEVPFEKGDTIADVTVRLLNAMGIGYDFTGKVEDGFYLASLNDFELNGTYYPTFGEFDAGSQSGWCVRINDWHINQGSSAVEVEEEDVISWLYTCQYGADVGADFSSKSAKIKGVTFNNGDTLANDAEDKKYTYEVSADTTAIGLTLDLENYASVVTLTVDGQEVKYRPGKDITVKSNSTLVISTELEYMDADNNNEVTTYTDSMTIQLAQPNVAPVVAENAMTAMEAAAGEEIEVDLSTLFTDGDGDALTYKVVCEALNLSETLEGSVFTGTIPAAGAYEFVVTASDEAASASHTVTITVTEAKENTAPNIKAEYADTKEHTYVYSSSYVYIYMDDIFEDADGDTLTYEATLNGEKTEVAYNSWSKEYYIQFSTKPVKYEYKIKAYDGQAYSEEFTAYCIGTSATITAPEDSPLIPGGNYYYYVLGTAKDDTFKLDYSLDMDTDIVPDWYSSNTSVLTVNEDGSFTVNEVTSRQQLYVGVTYGKDTWGSVLYLGTKNFYILPAMPEVADITVALPEHADNVVATNVSSAFSGWYSSEFDYEMENPAIADIKTSGTYGLSVTPKALGTTTVTATFKHDASIKCTFDITVTGRSLHIKDQPGADSVDFVEGKTVQMEVKGAEEGETFTWTSGNNSVATVDENGLVTLKALGTAYITATSSLSTEEVPVKASMYLQVKEAGKVYLEDVALTQYGYFGHLSAKSAFNSATLTYDWDLQENRYTYGNLQFTPYFDGENLNAVLHYQVSGGDYQTMDLTDGKAVSITNGLKAGENVVKIEVSPKEDADNVTTYTFHIFRPYNPTNTITGMTIYPNTETALSYPTYEGQKEGTLFQYNAETGEFAAGWNGKPATGWSSSVDTYKVFLYGTRTSEFSYMPVFGYTEQRVMVYVNGEAFEESVTRWESNSVALTDEIIKIEFHVNSEKYHAEKLAAGVEDPYAEPEKKYTIYVENVTPLGIDAQILSAKLETGEFYLPGFTSDTYTISALVANGQETENMTFTVPADIEVYKTSTTAANKLTATGQDEDGNNIYTIALAAKNYSYAYATTNIILQATDAETGETGLAQYAFTVHQRGEKDIYPDEITEYLCIGSQYTNAGSYGTMPERTLKVGGGVLSLGHFGGHITYKYNTPIKNDPNNPYGVDFVVYGNSFGAGAHEPGYVEVSEDGENWYVLAGSDHYEDYSDWDYSVTYTNEGGKSSYKTSADESGTIYNYPQASRYPYFDWTEELEESMTVKGYRLSSTAKDIYGSAASVLPDFGYVDVNTNPKAADFGTAANPYNHPGKENATGDQFDISWAVDKNGMPVELDSISYIRVSTASFIYAGAIGEKSTEVTAVAKVKNAAEAAVGITEAPVIKINGTEVKINENTSIGNYVYDLSAEDASFTVEVEAAEGASVYINSDNGAARTYETAPEKEIIRIIVQEGEKEPYIAYISLKDADIVAAETVMAKISSIGEVTLESEETIKAVREAYDALTENQKALVTNYDVLENAEKALAQLKKDALSIEDIYKTTGDYLEALAKENTPTVNSTGGEWLVLGLLRSGRGEPEGYYDNVVKYVQEHINDKEQLHRAKSTDNARVILALTAAGYDVTDVAGHNLLAGLTDMSYVQRQGINGPIWALIAFDSHGYEIPENADPEKQVTREKLIEVILAAQLSDGGWALSGSAADSDMTGMAIQALAPYYESDEKVKAAVDSALTCLSNKQLSNGVFATTDGATAESCAQVIVALTALGINPDKDERFVKNGASVMDALASYYVEGGGFKHVANGSIDGMASEQGYYALTAYMRMLEDKTALYEMSDVEIDEKTEDSGEEDKNEPEETPEDEPKDEPEETPEDEPKDEPEETPEDEPKDEPEETPEDEPKDEPEEIPEDESKDEPEETPEDEPKEDNKAVQTGDDAPIMQLLWISFLAMAGAGTIFIKRSKKA